MFLKIITFPIRLLIAAVLVLLSAVLIIACGVFMVLYTLVSLVISKLIVLFCFMLGAYIIAMVVLYFNGGDVDIGQCIMVGIFIGVLMAVAVFAPNILEQIYLLLMKGATGLWIVAADVMMW